MNKLVHVLSIIFNIGGFSVEKLGSANFENSKFFYPVYISIQNDGNTLVEVGIESRLYQGGPLVTRAHKIFYDRVRNAISSKH